MMVTGHPGTMTCVTVKSPYRVINQRFLLVVPRHMGGRTMARLLPYAALIFGIIQHKSSSYQITWTQPLITGGV
jgi:hypothetical protein